MPNSIFRIFSDERFLDLTIYQYGHEKCAPLHSFGPHIRNHYLFHYVISGKGWLSIKKDAVYAEYKINAGTGFLIEPEWITHYSADRLSPWEYTWVEFDGLRARNLLQEAGLSIENPIFSPVSKDAALHLQDEMLRLAGYSDPTRPYRLIGQLYLIMDALAQGSLHKKRLQGGKLSRFYAQEALSFIEQNYAFPITVEDMAKQCNLDRSYFGKVFKDAIGQSPQDFLIHYRMTKASSLLTSTTLPISSISVQVGYQNQMHFSRAFKKTYGMSPREYRMQNKLV